MGLKLLLAANESNCLSNFPEIEARNGDPQRPWGNYRVLSESKRYKVKEITVLPGKKLSLQKHYHRSEHWVVVSGTAIVTRDGESIIAHENESVFLPLGCVHRLENPGKIDLVLIEVQTGSYLGEDDIIRLEDEYGRA